MCLIAFAIDAEPGCPLLIASNRDEFLDRPTAPLHRWALAGGAQVVAGRDLRDGGTWLGVSDSGRVAMLTNVREARPGAGQRSRGELPTRWLAGELHWRDLAEAVDPAAYGGFNLVVGDFHSRSWAWISNRDPQQPHACATPRLHARPLEAGVYGLSNASLDTPWPKTTALKQAVTKATRLAAQQPAASHWIGSLSRALGDVRPALRHELPATGAPADWEQALSSPFVRLSGQGYGTRSSLVIHATPVEDEPAASARTARWAVHLREWTHSHADGGSEAGHAIDWALACARHETLLW